MWRSFSIAAGTVLLLVGVYIFLSQTNLLDSLMDSVRLKEQINDLGVWGPLTVVGLLALARFCLI